MTTAAPKVLTANECGGAFGKTDFTFGVVGDVLVAPFQMPEGMCSGRCDVSLTGEVGTRVRFRVTTSELFLTTDAGVPGVIVIEGAVTLTQTNEFFTIGSGPLWVGRWINVRAILEVLGPLGNPITGTVELNVHDRPSAPFRALGIGVAP